MSLAIEFSGFGPKAFKFLEELKDNQNRVWFAEHRSEYEDFVRKPMKRFTEALSESLNNKDVPLWGDPKDLSLALIEMLGFQRQSIPTTCMLVVYLQEQAISIILEFYIFV